MNRGLEALVYVCAVILMFIRVDLWWWGKDMPVYAGWITVPMLYQLGIWAAGYILVFIVCFKVWRTE